jgi:hypothetical protein
MDNYLEISKDLIESECLHTFCIVEIFCESCDKTTPHEISDEDQIQECVPCKRDEEQRLDFEIKT